MSKKNRHRQQQQDPKASPGAQVGELAKPQEAVPAPAAEKPPVEAPKPESSGRWQTFFNWFGVVGTVFTIVAFFVGFYFFHASQLKPEICYAVNPLRTELQRPDFDKKLGFTYDGKELSTESLSIATVAIWNAGNDKPSAPLVPFKLKLGEKCRILSARVKYRTSDVTGFEVVKDDAVFAEGECPIRWALLEPEDGAVVQIIYEGSASVPVGLTGSVEKQRHPRKIGLVSDKDTMNLYAAMGTFVIVAVFAVVRDISHWRQRRESLHSRIFVVLWGVMAIFVVGCDIWLFIRHFSSPVPSLGW